MGKFSKLCKNSVVLVSPVPLLFCSSGSVHHCIAISPKDKEAIVKQVCSIHDEFVVFHRNWEFLVKASDTSLLTERVESEKGFVRYGNYTLPRLKESALECSRDFLRIYDHLEELYNFFVNKEIAGEEIVQSFHQLLVGNRNYFRNIANYLESDYVAGECVSEYFSQLYLTLHNIFMRFLTDVVKGFGAPEKLFSDEEFLCSVSNYSEDIRACNK